MHNILKSEIRWPPILLRPSHRQVASNFYECCICQRVISPGEEYLKEVWVHQKVKPKGRLFVKRCHICCPHDWQEEECDKDMEADRRAEEMEREQIPQAAAA